VVANAPAPPDEVAAAWAGIGVAEARATGTAVGDDFDGDVAGAVVVDAVVGSGQAALAVPPAGVRPVARISPHVRTPSEVRPLRLMSLRRSLCVWATQTRSEARNVAGSTRRRNRRNALPVKVLH